MTELTDLQLSLTNASTQAEFDQIVKYNGITYEKLPCQAVNGHRKIGFTYEHGVFVSMIDNELLADEFLKPADRLRRNHS